MFLVCFVHVCLILIFLFIIGGKIFFWYSIPPPDKLPLSITLALSSVYFRLFPKFLQLGLQVDTETLTILKILATKANFGNLPEQGINGNGKKKMGRLTSSPQISWGYNYAFQRFGLKFFFV